MRFCANFRQIKTFRRALTPPANIAQRLHHLFKIRDKNTTINLEKPTITSYWDVAAQVEKHKHGIKQTITKTLSPRTKNATTPMTTIKRIIMNFHEVEEFFLASAQKRKVNCNAEVSNTRAACGPRCFSGIFK